MNGAFSCKDLTMNFSSEEVMVYLVTTHFVSFNSAVVSKCNVSLSPIVTSSNVYMYFSLNELVFVFVAPL